MDPKLVKLEIKTVILRFIEVLKPKNLFQDQVEEINYELSPCLYFFVLDLLCHYSIVNACFWFYIFLNIGICCLEIAFFLTTKLVLAQHCFIASFQLLGILASFIVVNSRESLLIAEKRAKDIQWSLKYAKKRTKAVIGKRGLYQSLKFEFVLLLAFMDVYFIVSEIRQTFLMIYVQQFENIFLTSVAYFIEITDVLTMCYFVLVVPHLHIYFATESEIQVFLLAEYVNDTAKRMEKACLDDSNSEDYDKKVKRYLKFMLSRYCEIKQLYLDNKKKVNAAGLTYILPSSVITVFIIYAAFEGDLSVITLSMHVLVFTTVLIITMTSGQRYEDEWLYFYESVCKLPWYTWNVQNQKVYLTLLVGASKKVELIILQTIVVNYSLCIRVWKVVYGGASMISNLHKK